MMLIDGLTNAGAMPSLELTMRFAAQRQRLVAHNLANIDTPDFIQQDVSTGDFQKTLSQAIDARRDRTGGRFGPLPWAATSELRPDSRGEMRLVPLTPVGGPLAHDRNNRDLERTLQDLAESAGVFKAAASLYASQRGMLRDAIAERA
jgi:flagellar basal-body rod protein FlgB